MARLAAFVAVALLVLAIIGFLRGPEATLAALRDAAAIEQHIDGPALRHSLGRLLLQQTGAVLPGGSSDSQLLGQFIVAGALVKPLVETFLRPEGIAALLDGRIAARPLAPPGEYPAPRVNFSWSGLSTVRGTVMTPAGEPALILLLRRDGLSWRLAGVEAAVTHAATLRQAP